MPKAKFKLTDAQEKQVENKIKNVLREKGLTQREIGEKLDFDESAFSKKLGKANSFNLAFLYELANSMDVSIYDLLPDTFSEEPPEIRKIRRIMQETPPVSYRSLALMLYQLRKQASSPYKFRIETRQGRDLTGRDVPHMEINVYGKEFFSFFQTLDVFDVATGFAIETTNDLETAAIFKETLTHISGSLMDSLPDYPMKKWTTDQYYYYGKLLDAGVQDSALDIWSQINDWDQSEPFDEYIKPLEEQLRRIYGDTIFPEE